MFRFVWYIFTALMAIIWVVCAIILMGVSVSGCAPEIQTVYITQPLHHPSRPVLPKIKAADLQCLNQNDYQKLYDRQRLITDYAIMLEAIIDSTIKEPDSVKK